MSWIFSWFGCRHANLSRIWTLRPVIRRAKLGWPEVLGEKRTYRCCTQCGREFPVCWETFGEVESRESIGILRGVKSDS